MDWLDQTRVAVDSIRSNKLRSFLTTLGVVIGVTSVILLVSIGEGLRVYLSDIFAGMGSTCCSSPRASVTPAAAGMGRCPPCAS